MDSSHQARQPVHAVWLRDRLVHEWAVALGNAMDKLTLGNYNSAFNSYLTFVKHHNLPSTLPSPTQSERIRAVRVDPSGMVGIRVNSNLSPSKKKKKNTMSDS